MVEEHAKASARLATSCDDKRSEQALIVIGLLPALYVDKRVGNVSIIGVLLPLALAIQHILAFVTK